MLLPGVAFQQQISLISVEVGGTLQWGPEAKVPDWSGRPTASPNQMPCRARVLARGGRFQQKRPQRRSAAAWKRAPLLSGAVVSCCPLRWRGPATCGRPNVPMTVRDLAQRDWEWPSSGPPERGPVPVQAWVREPALVQPWAQQAWVLQAWALQAWVLQAWVLRPWVLRPWVQPPSFWRGSFWRWPFWLTFSALPPSTSWRISSLPSWPFSPTSSKISSRLFSSPLQAFYSF